MSRRVVSIVAFSIGALALGACRCGTETPGSSTVGPPNPTIQEPFDSSAPFVPPRVGTPRIPGVRISPRIFQNVEVPDAATP